MTDKEQYLKLRGSNKDILYYFRRTQTRLKEILKKNTISQSLNTSDIKEARRKRDSINKEIDDLIARTHEGQFRYFLDEISGLSREEREGS